MWLPDVIKRHRQEAIDAYTEALKIHPETVWALVQRGRVFASEDDSRKLAMDDFQQAHNLAPGYASVTLYLAGVLNQLGRKGEAAENRRSAERVYPKEAEDLYWLGNITGAQKHDFTQAYKYYSACLLLKPDHYWARLERVLYGEDPKVVFPLSKQARTEELRLAKTLRPDLPFASELIAYFSDEETAVEELQFATKKFGPDLLRAGRMADLLIGLGEFESAERTLRSVLSQDPGGEIAGRLGGLKLRTGDYNEAMRWYRESIRAGRADPATFRSYAQAATGAGDCHTAEKAFLDGIKSNPTSPNLLENAGQWYEKQGRFEDAERVYRMACKLPASEDSTPESNLASLLERQHRVDEAIKVLVEGIARRTSQRFGSFEMKEQLGRAYISTGRLAEARKLVKEECRKRPYKPIQDHMLINLLDLLGEHREALLAARSAELSEFVKDESTSVDAPLMLADPMEYIERLKTRRALGMVLGESCYLNLAGCSQDADESIAIINEGIKQHPRSFDLHAHLAVLLRRKGKTKVAQEVYHSAVKLFVEDVQKAIADTKNPSGIGLKGEAWDRHLRYLAPPISFVDACFTYLAEGGRASEMSVLQERILTALAPLRQAQQEGQPGLRAFDPRQWT